MFSSVKKTGWYLLVLLFIALPAKAAELDALLRIHAALLPRTVLMDYQFERKLVDEAIVVGIVCENKDWYHAEQVREYIAAKYENGLKNYQVRVKIFSYGNLPDSAEEATIFYLMPARGTAVSTALKSLGNERLIFAFDPDDLRYGATISLNIRKKIIPVLNLDALRERNISLRPVIMKISQMYYQQQ